MATKTVTETFCPECSAIIDEHAPETDNGVPIDEIYELAAEEGLGNHDVDVVIGRVENSKNGLLDKGEVYEPMPDHYRPT
jgi:hypothetical protein